MDSSDAIDEIPSAAHIAAALETHGSFTMRIDPLPHQRMVDLHWAAHQAGRILGIKVSVLVDRPLTATEPRADPVTVTVRRQPSA